MPYFFLFALTIALATVAKYLWKIEQVYAIAALFSGSISLVVDFVYTPAWGQVAIVGLLVGLYRFYFPTTLEQLPLQVPSQKS
jgi:hypothetical protein